MPTGEPGQLRESMKSWNGNRKINLKKSNIKLYEKDKLRVGDSHVCYYSFFPE
jgi:hypothetical protein